MLASAIQHCKSVITMCVCVCVCVYVCVCIGMYMHAKSLQSCVTLCDPVDHSLPGSSVHGILQAKILRWVAIPYSRGSSRPKDQSRFLHLLHWQAGSLPLMPPGRLYIYISPTVLILFFFCFHFSNFHYSVFQLAETVPL